MSFRLSTPTLSPTDSTASSSTQSFILDKKTSDLIEGLKHQNSQKLISNKKSSNKQANSIDNIIISPCLSEDPFKNNDKETPNDWFMKGMPQIPDQFNNVPLMHPQSRISNINPQPYNNWQNFLML